MLCTDDLAQGKFDEFGRGQSVAILVVLIRRASSVRAVTPTSTGSGRFNGGPDPCLQQNSDF